MLQATEDKRKEKRRQKVRACVFFLVRVGGVLSGTHSKRTSKKKNNPILCFIC